MGFVLVLYNWVVIRIDQEVGGVGEVYWVDWIFIGNRYKFYLNE